MDTKTEATFTANVWVGLRERTTGNITDIREIREYLQSFVNARGFCVSLSSTEFIYTNGAEPGVVVGLINYPRFPSTNDDLKQKALEIAEGLRKTAKQLKVSVVFPDQTVMLSEEPS